MKAQYITPAVTFFSENGELNQEENKKLYDYLIAGGIDGIAVLGSSGEFFSMSMDQRKELIQLACGHIKNRVKTLIGVGCMTAEETVELADFALGCGADGVMIVGPYYINLSAERIEAYFSQVIGQIKGDVYLYNYPDRTGFDIDPQMTYRLLKKHGNIVGYKDTLVSMGHTREVLKATTHNGFPDFQVFCGYDDNFAHNVMDGGAGAISALSNLVPDVCAKWVDAFRDNNLEKVAEIQKYIDCLMDLYSIETPFIPVMKKALMMKGLDVSPWCASPLSVMAPEKDDTVKKLLENLNITKG